MRSLYHLLTGRPPFFDDLDLAVVLEKVQAGALTPPRSLLADVPRPLESICLKAMSKRPEDRYANARALADDLEQWLADEPVSARPDAITDRLARWTRHHRAAAQAAAATLMVITAVSIVSAFLIDRARRGEREALRETNRALAAEMKAKSEAQEQRTRAEGREQLAIDAVKKFRDVVLENEQLRNREDLKPVLARLLKEPLEFFKTLRGHLQTSLDTRPETLHRLAHANYDLGMTADEIGNKTDALQAVEEARALWERLTGENPSVTEYQRDLAQSYHYIGTLQVTTGRTSESLGSYQNELVIWERLVREDPSDMQFQSRMARSCYEIGRLQAATGWASEALESYRKALAIQKWLVRENPSGQRRKLWRTVRRRSSR